MKAVTALERNLACGIPTAEIRAAVAVLEQAAKGAEILDFARRLESLEQVPAPQGDTRESTPETPAERLQSRVRDTLRANELTITTDHQEDLHERNQRPGSQPQRAAITSIW